MSPPNAIATTNILAVLGDLFLDATGCRWCNWWACWVGGVGGVVAPLGWRCNQLVLLELVVAV